MVQNRRIQWLIVLGVQIQRARFTATVVFNPSVKAVQQHCQPIGHCEKDYMNGEENESVLSFLPVKFNEVAGRADILFDVLECQKSSGSLHYHFFVFVQCLHQFAFDLYFLVTTFFRASEKTLYLHPGLEHQE